MKKIPLTQNKVTLIDNEDYEELIQFRWYYSKSNNTARRSCDDVYIHRVIMNAPSHLEVDHRDTNRLNNQRANLRLCTHAENLRNLSPRQECSSIYKGVSWDKRRQKWLSRIKFEWQNYQLGYLEDERQAALFYDIAAVHFFGEFARLNFPEHIEFINNYWKEKEEVRADVH